jgi:hypothetical protein
VTITNSDLNELLDADGFVWPIQGEILLPGTPCRP